LPCNNLLIIIFRSKTDEITGGYRKLHNEKLYNLYSSPNIIIVIKSIWREWVGHLARRGKNKSAHNFMVGKPEGNGPLGRLRREWSDPTCRIVAAIV
jgi:hypothetical protein